MQRRYQRLPDSETHPTAPLLPQHALRPSTAAAPSRPATAAKQSKRTTKTSQKLALFPEDVGTTPVASFSDDANVYQYPHVKTSKEDFLWRVDKKSLPRATAYCTASSYKMDLLMDYLLSRKLKNATAPVRFDEALYTPYRMEADVFDHVPGEASFDSNFIAAENPASIFSSTAPKSFNSYKGEPDVSGSYSQVASLLSGYPDGGVSSREDTLRNNQIKQGYNDYKSLVRNVSSPELFFFDYGVVVMWGLTEEEERSILKDIRQFEDESIDHSDVEAERFHYLYSRQQQARIYNDIITLISPTSSKMIKLTISHAFAQSVKLTLFEGLIEETIDSTKHIPAVMAETGKIHMPRKAINQKIGQLFIMRINVNLVSNVLDTPEIFWSEPALEPLYMAVRTYLEIAQRVELLNQRTRVISDLLSMLKDNLTSIHGEKLEWIVILLILGEIIIGIITLAFDLATLVHKP